MLMALTVAKDSLSGDYRFWWCSCPYYCVCQAGCLDWAGRRCKGRYLGTVSAWVKKGVGFAASIRLSLRNFMVLLTKTLPSSGESRAEIIPLENFLRIREDIIGHHSFPAWPVVLQWWPCYQRPKGVYRSCIFQVISSSICRVFWISKKRYIYGASGFLLLLFFLWLSLIPLLICICLSSSWIACFVLFFLGTG